MLCDLEGLSYDEVAVALGVKLGTVRSRIHRGGPCSGKSSRTATRGRKQALAPRLKMPRIAGLL